MIRWLSSAISATILTLGFSPAALAHHSFAAEFDINKPVVLKGKLTKMEWANPHGWIYVDVKDAKGVVTNWSVEAGAPNALIRRGLRKTDFPIGSAIEVHGYRAKSGRPVANAINVIFADGRNFFVGSSGTGAPVPPGAKDGPAPQPEAGAPQPATPGAP